MEYQEIPVDGTSIDHYHNHKCGQTKFCSHVAIAVRGSMVDRSSNFDTEGTDPAFSDRTAEDPDFFAPAIASAEGEIMGPHLIVLPEGLSRAEAVAYLSKDIPTIHGLPQYFIRSDLLHTLASGAISQEDIDTASLGLSYTEGFPALDDGRAFWAQLPHEPLPSYLLFQKYLEQAESEGIRQLDLLSHSTSTPSGTLRQNYLEFYWSARARAYDLFLIAAQERKRQLRIRSMENTHFDVAAKRLDELMGRFEDDEDGNKWWEELDAAEAVELLIELAKLQRLSVGLTGQNASSMSRTPIPEGAGPQAILEHLTKEHVLSEDASGNFQQKLNALLNGGDGMQVQDAIIRFTRPQVDHGAHGAYQEE